MIYNKKFNFATKRLLSNKSAQLGDSGFIKRSFSEGTLDVTSKKFFAGFLSIFAIILWVIDISTSFFGLFPLGRVYSGFNFNPQDFWNNWFSSFTFGNVYFDAILALTILFMVVKYVRSKTLPNPVDIISIFLGLMAVIFLLTNPDWMAFPKAVLHFLLIITFGIYVWRTSSMSAGFLVVFGLIFFDFFLFSTLLQFIPFLQYISLLGAIIIAITFGQSPNRITGASFFLLLLFIIVMTVVSGTPTQGVRFTESELQKASLNDVLDKLTTGISNYQKQISLGVQRQIQFAITGKVEENQYEPLGVYLNDVKPAQSKFYSDEEVVIWGTVSARTLDDPINIKVGCFKGKRKDKEFANRVDPNKTFSVFTLEEQDFACSFKGQEFKTGSKSVTAFADFNFETLAFLKVFFMDRERLRAMTRQNQDPFEEFDIKDKNPKAIYTNGPVEIGMETTSSLIGVSKNYLALPRLRLSIQNKQGWEGKITALKELILLFPKGTKITDPANDCVNTKFEEYDVDACKKKSCKTFVQDECLEVCKGFKEGTTEYTSCTKTCNEEFDECKKECSFLFQDEGEKYLGFSLAEDELTNLNKKLLEGEFFDLYVTKVSSPLDVGIGFSCSFNPNPLEVLGNTPFTTKSIRVKVRYDYSVEKHVSVRIDEVTGLDEKREDAVGGRAIKGSTATIGKVVELVNQLVSKNPVLILAIARQESSLRHCKDGSLNCGTNNVANVNCNSVGSCGIMQINRGERAHADLFRVENSRDSESRLRKFGCKEGETAYDLDCNIKSGIGVFQGYIDQYANDDVEYERGLSSENACGGDKTSQEFKDKYLEKYGSYKGINRAIRAYNGLGCVPPGADVDYVKNVRDKEAEIYSGA